MNATRKLLSINFRTYIVPIMVVVAIFFATDYLLVMSIRSHYMTMLETQMTSFGMIYSHSLAKGSEAYSLIYDLLEEKLLVRRGRRQRSCRARAAIHWLS